MVERKKKEKKIRKNIFSKKKLLVDVKICLIRLYQTFRIFFFYIYNLKKKYSKSKGKKIVKKKNCEGMDIFSWKLKIEFIKK